MYPAALAASIACRIASSLPRTPFLISPLLAGTLLFTKLPTKHQDRRHNAHRNHRDVTRRLRYGAEPLEPSENSIVHLTSESDQMCDNDKINSLSSYVVHTRRSRVSIYLKALYQKPLIII